ncbi:MAG: thiamine phosphate synthase [Saprospiraceae bacterium]|nr:thiamine phosphate synthase [Saprospiraceae bacterium]
MKAISQLHYITQGNTPQEHLQQVETLCQAGANWIQLRLKNMDLESMERTAKEARAITRKYSVTLIINDHVQIAKIIQADGVHLGQQDMSILQARSILGKNFILGGTANTWEDIVSLHRQEVDYIGLGPLHYTQTKKKLSPILGLNGYKDLLVKMQKHGIKVPVLAIGGITQKDLVDLKNVGVHGVAISSYLLNMPVADRVENIDLIYQIFTESDS